jgi:hypothetical protein
LVKKKRYPSLKARAVPNALAGFIEAPDSLPPAKIDVVTHIPTASGPNVFLLAPVSTIATRIKRIKMKAKKVSVSIDWM